MSNKAKILKIREKRGKNLKKTWLMTKKKEKGHQKFLPQKWKFFPEKSHLGRRTFFPSPQTRRQVSATA